MDLLIVESVASVYASASREAEQVSEVVYGGCVTIVEEVPGWYKVFTDDAYQGWLEKRVTTPFCPDRQKANCTVQAFWTPLYHEPDVTIKQPLVRVPYGAKLTIVEKCLADSRWCQALTVQGDLAWVQKEDLRKTSLTKKDLVAEAKRFMGIPYLWGGCTPFGFDCSGFVQTLYRQLGVILPRDASLQVAFGEIITDRFDPADLLFFTPPNDSSRITHVGMSIGDDLFIHSVTTNPKGVRGVRIDSLADPFWNCRFLLTKRIKIC